jgi:hypothetical protein
MHGRFIEQCRQSQMRPHGILSLCESLALWTCPLPPQQLVPSLSFSHSFLGFFLPAGATGQPVLSSALRSSKVLALRCRDYSPARVSADGQTSDGQPGTDEAAAQPRVIRHPRNTGMTSATTSALIRAEHTMPRPERGRFSYASQPVGRGREVEVSKPFFRTGVTSP